MRILQIQCLAMLCCLCAFGCAPVKRGAPSHPFLLDTSQNATNAAPAHHPLFDYNFTNESGQAVSLGQFKGQALAITFFFTRCPIPEFCPRLSRNFAQAAHKLSSIPRAPTNWHFLSVTFDPELDTPPVLKAYGEKYQYDPSHW